MNRIVRIFLAIALLSGLAYFFMRNMILEKVAERYVDRVKTDYGFVFRLQGLRMTGLAGVQIDRMEVYPASAEDTLLVIDSLYVRPSMLHLLVGRLKMTELHLSSLMLHLVRKKDYANYRPERHAAEKSDTAHGESDYGKFLHDMSRRAFNLSPQKAYLQRMTIRLENDTASEQIFLPYFISDGDSLHAKLDMDSLNGWRMDGTFSQDEETFHVRIVPDRPATPVPVIGAFLGGYLSFDTLDMQGSVEAYRSGIQTLTGFADVSGLQALHARLSDDTVDVNKYSSHVTLHIGKDFAELDSASSFRLNELEMGMYARVDKGRNPAYSFRLRSGPQQAGVFFRSLPRGMFSELQDVDARGTLDFSLRFHMETLHPDDLLFDVSMVKNKFHLIRFGSNSLLKMNSEFGHTVYEYGRPVRSFPVGPSWPGYVPIDQVSPYLKYAILTSEDGNFYFHNGFNEEAFRNSIATNYKAGRFVRGGSTITMQLVKNVYLTRKKTVARKAEEAFIVWLIESNRLVSKDRMFEVYLNIIELGPMVYGVKEASAFYFNKAPSALTLSESIFLASLLPHPKWFKYSFDSTGTLKPYLADYYRVVSNFMLRKNLITQEEYDHIEPRVQLAGPAKYMVLPSDTIPKEDSDDDQ